ncbi:2-oxo-4-hydroxy-4-carboxy-5-ureidoimidazoline decarboxylase [Streptomyces sp. AJS327]|uniref:2-oxo-4-hydroxy-4-carboxy-5-ureidoimidazoline decarboxylase n=1 Tax=Streptomyces sp. AJS327 TaxID=2545265 RepID=UPI0035B508B7
MATDAAARAPTPRGSLLHRLNHAPAAQAETVLLSCCGSRRWAARLAAHRPYPDMESLLAAADEASYDLTREELTEALARERALHPSTDQPAALAAHTALRAAHTAYERRFGHTFIICLDGLCRSERLDQTLSGIRTRLNNEPDEERVVTANELRRLARGRLERLLTALR